MSITRVVCITQKDIMRDRTSIHARACVESSVASAQSRVVMRRGDVSDGCAPLTLHRSVSHARGSAVADDGPPGAPLKKLSWKITWPRGHWNATRDHEL